MDSLDGKPPWRPLIQCFRGKFTKIHGTLSDFEPKNCEKFWAFRGSGLSQVAFIKKIYVEKSEALLWNLGWNETFLSFRIESV